MHPMAAALCNMILVLVVFCQVNAYPDLMNILVRVASSQAFHAYMKVGRSED
jgi:hypothetical protein